MQEPGTAPSQPQIQHTSPEAPNQASSITSPQQEPPSQTLPPSQQSANTQQLPLLILGVAALLFIGSGIFFYLSTQNTSISVQIDDPSPVPVTSPTANSTVPSPSSQVSPSPESSNTSNIPTGWETKTTHAFEISFPAGLTTNSTDEYFSLMKLGPDQKLDTELYDGFSLSVTILDDTKYPTVQAFVDETTGIAKDQFEILSEVLKEPHPVVINGYSGQSFSTRGLGEHTYFVLESDNGQQRVAITLSLAETTDNSYQTEASQILDTFKFVE